MYGLKFKGKHSYRDYKIIMQSEDRSLLPEVKKQKIEIPFIDGDFDLQKEPVYMNRIITVKFSFHYDTLENFELKKRALAEWLTGRDILIFDDEPDKYYDAKVFQPVSLKPVFGTAAFIIPFETSPFAMNAAQMQVDVITTQNQNVHVQINGNIKTSGVIILTNTGTTTINKFSLRRERLKG